MNEILTYVNSKIAELGPGAKPICIAYVGSRAYGLDTPESDYDITGLYLPTELHLYGLKSEEFVKLPKDNNVEGMIYDIRMWFRLIYSQNPNIIEMLWLQDEAILYSEGMYWPFLKAHRKELLCQRLITAYSKYAYQQFLRLKRFDKEKNQNKRRLEIFEKFGYDTKAASYIIKLLLTGIEASTKGTVTPKRVPQELELLRNIRAGEYSYEEIKNMWEELDEELLNSPTVLQEELPPLLQQNLQLAILRSHTGILEYERHKNGISEDLQTSERQICSDEN